MTVEADLQDLTNKRITVNAAGEIIKLIKDGEAFLTNLQTLIAKHQSTITGDVSTLIGPDLKEAVGPRLAAIATCATILKGEDGLI